MINIHSVVERIQAACHKPFIAVLVVITCAAALYYPFLYTFVGTDLGVYYELGRRFADDGYIALWDNYWDHKPPSYLLFSPFVVLDRLIGPNWGLKAGAFALYVSSILLVQLAVRVSAQNRPAVLSATAAAVLVAAMSFGWLDFALNGILLVAAVCLSFSGLVLAGPLQGRAAGWRIVLAGVLIGASPVFRPTAITAFALLTAGALIDVHSRTFGSVFRAWIVASITLGLLALMTIAIAGGPANAWETLVHYNSAYRSTNANVVSIADFFTQDQPAFYIAVAALLFILVALPACRTNWRTWALPVLWLAAEIVSMIWQRKIQSFYVLGFLLPAILVAAFIPATLAKDRAARLAALLLAAALVFVVQMSWSKLSPTVFQNRMVDQLDQLTSKVPELLAAHTCPQSGPSTLFVYGNRAQLYTNAARLGIEPFEWPAYANPLIDGSSVAGRSHQLFQQWETKRPRFIVYAGGPGWDPNIAGRSTFIEQQITQHYVELPVPSATGSEWPYRYVYRVYRARCDGD